MTDAENQWLRSLAGLRVAIVGDVMIDRYLTGVVRRVSPEAPVPVVELADRQSRLGGAANVALNVRELGAEPVLLSVVGRDDDAEELERLMHEAGLSTHSHLVREPGRRTTIKTRIIAGNQHLLRVDAEDTHPVSAGSITSILDRLEGEIRQGGLQVIIIQDYNKGLLTPELITGIVRIATEHGVPVTVDPKFRNFLAYGGVTLFKPNLKELSEGLARPVSPDFADLVTAVRDLARTMPHRFAVVTLSEHGIFWYDQETGAGEVIPPVSRDIVDVCGAGDTVIAVASVLLASGRPIRDVARVANLAGGLVCERVGVVPIDAEALVAEVIHPVHP